MGRWDSTTGGSLDLSLELPASDLPLSAIGVPDPNGPEGDVDEAWDEEEERNSGAELVANGTLHGGEAGTTRNSHDKKTGGSSGVSTKTGGTEDEDDWVHDAHTVEDEHEADNRGEALDRADADEEDRAEDGVGEEEDRGRDEGEQGGTDESSDGEDNQSVTQELSTPLVLDTGLLGSEEEVGTAGDLSTDIEELSDGTGDGSVLLPEGFVGLSVDTLGEGESLSLGVKRLLTWFGQLGEEEGNGDDDTHESDGEVDPLDVCKGVRVLVGEEVLGGDQWSGERGDSVERLGELQSEVGHVVGWDDRDVRVGGDFERGQTTSDDGGADDETTEDGLVGGFTGVFGDWPEEDSTKRVETQTHDDGGLVTSSLHDLSGNRREGKVTDTKVGSLKTSRLSLRDTEDRPEVTVEDIEETVCETPEEEEGSDEDECPN